MAEEFNLSVENEVYDISFNEETSEIIVDIQDNVTAINVDFHQGYYPFPNDIDLTGYYTKVESDARYKPISYTPTWSEVSGKPTVFTPSAHTHPISEVTNLQTTLDNKVDKVIGKQLSTEDYTTAEKNKLAGIQEGAEVNVNPDWNATSGDAEILNKPTEFPPSLHTHTIADVDNLGTTLDGKENSIIIGTTLQYWRGDKTWQTLDKNVVGLSNVDNTSDFEKNTATVVLKNKTIDGGTY